MRKLRFSLSWRRFSILIGICFALQALFLAPMHSAHGANQNSAHGSYHPRALASGHGESRPPLPEECRCDLCLAFRALDTASITLPPELLLVEAAFSVVAAYPSYLYSSPILYSQARGPPRFA